MGGYDLQIDNFHEGNIFQQIARSRIPLFLLSNFLNLVKWKH